MKKACKYLGYFILIFGTLGSIIMAYTYGKSISIKFILGETQSSRNWHLTISIFAGSLVSVLVISFLLLAISEFLDNQEQMLYRLTQLSNTQSDVATSVESKNLWYCKKCNSVNNSSSIICKQCGAYK